MKKILFSSLAAVLVLIGVNAQTWNSVPVGTFEDMYAVQFYNSTTGCAVGSNGTALRTTDGGQTWTVASMGVSELFFDVSFADASGLAFACGTNGTIRRTTNGGNSWSNTQIVSPGALYGISAVGSSIITVGTGGNMASSANGGSNWGVLSSGTTADLHDITRVSSTPGTAWVVGANGTILYTTNSGSSWAPQTSGTTNTLRGVHFVTTSQGWAVGNNGTILRTTNGGATWTAQTSGTTVQLNAVHFFSATTGWAVGNNGTILNTMNGGLTWTPQTSNTSFSLNDCNIPLSCRGIIVGFGAGQQVRRFEFIPAQPNAISGLASVCIGTGQTYSVTAVPGSTSYTWALPGGWTGSSTTNSITTTVGATGGTISVTANGECGSSVARTLSVTVNSIPAQPGSITGSTSVCSGSSQNYSVTAVAGATSYTWTLPGGWTGTSTTNSISANAGSSGGTINVIANNACGSSTASTLSVAITAIPPQPGAMTGNTTVCSGSSQTYNVAAVAGATSYTWTLPGGWTGTSTTNSISATVGATSGTVSVTANNGCGNSVARTLSVTVNPTPAQPGAISGSALVCTATSQSYSVSPVAGATSYTWTLPGGWTGTSTTNSINATVGASGGTVSVTANNGCGSSTPTTLAVTINSPAQPGIMTGNTSVCAGTSQSYSVPAGGGAGTTYSWTLPGGWSGTSTTESITTTAGAIGGTISVTANDACGSSIPRTLTVTVNAIPDQPTSISGLSEICLGESETYAVTAVSGATSYAWTLPIGWTGSSTTNSILVSPNPTSGNISVTANNACGASTPQSLTVNVSLQGDNTLSEAGGVLTSNESSADAYQWVDCNNGNAPISGATSQSYTPTQGGSYACEITIGSCIYTSNCASSTVGIIENYLENTIRIYPNPSNGVFSVEAGFNIESIEIYNSIGKIVQSERLNNAQKGQFQIINASGVYFISIVDAESKIKSTVRITKI
jgi:photosystem II stability/assembly factor-like uncharacterized protein